jgi:hypothetical protein
MKAATTNPTEGEGFRENNTQYSQTPTTMYYAQGTTNNLKSQSQAYKGMNNLIIYFDTQYKGLTSMAQAAWEAASISYAGQAICGCPNLDWGGQKLYRVVQYGSYIVGGGLIIVPPSSTFGDWPTPGAFYYYHTGISGGPEIYLGTPIYTAPNVLCIQVGLGLNNPVLQVPGSTGFLLIPNTEPAWPALWDMQSTDAIYTCGWSTGFSPAPPFKWTTLIEN